MTVNSYIHNDTRKITKIPQKSITRLFVYFNVLSGLKKKGLINSGKMSTLTGFKSSQIRRDLSYFGQFGTRAKGYKVNELKQQILKILGIDKEWKIAVIGIGDLGSALLAYEGFKEFKFNVVAAFDNDPNKIGIRKGNIIVEDISKLKFDVSNKGINIAIIVAPSNEVQKVVDYVVSCGIKTILNFAPKKIKVDNSVILVNIDMAVELGRLCYLATKTLAEASGGYLH